MNIQYNGVLNDSFGRTMRTLRVSVTDRCDLRCRYCMPAGGVEFKPHSELLSAPEFSRLLKIFAESGITRLKFTGGEPLLRPDLEEMVAAAAAIPGIQDLSLTTNATRLAGRAAALKAAGLKRVTVSLDALDSESFRLITRGGDFAKVWEGLLAAESAGLPVKLNCVVMKENDAELLKLAELTLSRDWDVRFIEYMPVTSPLAGLSGGVTPMQLKARLVSAFGGLEPLEAPASAPARRFRLPGAKGGLGFISSVSEKFCAACDRLRLGADGFLRLCMASPLGADLKAPLRQGAPDKVLSSIITAAVWGKPAGHDFDKGLGAPQSLMSSVGG